MRARYSWGPHDRTDGSWKKKPDGERPYTTGVIHPRDVEYLKFEISSLGAKTLLEFGPGSSTELFAKLGLKITTIEHMEKWYQVAKECFKDYPNVRVLKGEDEIPFLVPELDASEKFDIAFVDAPQGYEPVRKVHKGYEDCSRYNTTLFALQHAPVVFLHDVVRPLERGTLNRLNRMGYHIELIHVPYGMAKITCPQPEQTLSIAHSEISEPCPKDKQQTPIQPQQ